MYYDAVQDAFCYYSERETIYKYLDVVARYYCLTFLCKHLYVKLSDSDEKVIETPVEISGPFVTKKTEKKKLYEKKIIRFIYKGNESDYQLNQKKNMSGLDSKNINILDFLKNQKKEDRDSDEYENISKED